MTPQLPPLVERLIRKHRLRSHPNPQYGLRKIAACLRAVGDDSCSLASFYAHYTRNGPPRNLDMGWDVVALEYNDTFFDLRSVGRESIAFNSGKFSFGVMENVEIEIRLTPAIPPIIVPQYNQGHPMVKTAREFIAQQQSDALSKSTSEALNQHRVSRI